MDGRRSASRSVTRPGSRPPDTRAREGAHVPRSGTTLLDQVLGAHPHVEVIEEQELLLEVRRKWISKPHFDRLQAMGEEEVR